MARRGDGIYLRGLTWRLDFIHEGKRRAEVAVDPDPYLTLSDKDGKVIWKAP